MKQILPDVWETETESPFPGLTTHAYLVLRDEGNILFYNTGHLDEIEQMAAAGGVAYQFLSHRDELGVTILTIRERFGAKLGGHAEEKNQFAKTCPPDILFERHETLLRDIEVIPTPGHSPGSTCFFVSSPLGERYLFTGDTVYRNADGRWKAGFIPGYSKEEDRAVLAQSLKRLKMLQPDVVFSSAFSGDSGYQRMNPGDWPDYLNDAISMLMKREK